jgi:hypothetical protein
MSNWNVVLLGRVVGALIIAVGVGFSAWEAVEFGNRGFVEQDAGYEFRLFVLRSLEYVGTGILVIMAAEIAHRLWQRPVPLVQAQNGDEAARASDQ